MLHRLFRGHWPKWVVTGYDGLELHWGCLRCGATPLDAYV